MKILFFFYKRQKKLSVSLGFNKVLILCFIVANPVLYRYFHNFMLMVYFINNAILYNHILNGFPGFPVESVICFKGATFPLHMSSHLGVLFCLSNAN